LQSAKWVFLAFFVYLPDFRRENRAAHGSFSRKPPRRGEIFRLSRLFAQDAAEKRGEYLRIGRPEILDFSHD
jgi:hypothetical protein